MKRIVLILFALTLVFSLAACGNNGDSGNDSNNTNTSSNSNNTNSSGNVDKEDKPEEVTLRMAWWGSQPRHDYTLEVIDLYEQQNPHVTIEPEYAGWPDYWKKLGPQAAANELPDILQMDLSYLAQYGEKNQLADLTPFLNEQIDVSNISDSVVSGGSLGDQLYGFNLGVNAIGFHYDPALLKQAGVDSIPDDWTWSDYTDMAQKAADAGLLMDSGMQADVFFNYYLRTQGKTLYSADGSSLGYEDDQLFIDHFGQLADLVEKGAIPTPDVRDQIVGNVEMEPVVKNEGIGVWQWSNQFGGLQQVADRPMEMAPMPGPGMEKGLFLKPSMFFSIAENSKVKEEAAKFISFFVNNEEANAIIKGDRGVPGSSVVKESLKPLLTEQQAQVFDYISWAQEHSSPLDPVSPVGAGEVIALLDDITEELFFGEVTIEEAAAEFKTEANKILSNN